MKKVLGVCVLKGSTCIRADLDIAFKGLILMYAQLSPMTIMEKNDNDTAVDFEALKKQFRCCLNIINNQTPEKVLTRFTCKHSGLVLLKKLFIKVNVPLDLPGLSHVTSPSSNAVLLPQEYFYQSANKQ